MTVFRHWIAAVGFLCFTAAAASELSSLEEQMSGEEFRKAGLEKLSPDELRYLNAWLKGRDIDVTRAPQATAPSRAEPKAPAAAASEPSTNQERVALGFRPERVEKDVVISRIDGPFEGWLGKGTVFKLQNGQVWEQVGTSKFRYSAMSPEVRIEPKFSGTWRLYVEGLNRSVKVERIK